MIITSLERLETSMGRKLGGNWKHLSTYRSPLLAIVSQYRPVTPDSLEAPPAQRSMSARPFELHSPLPFFSGLEC